MASRKIEDRDQLNEVLKESFRLVDQKILHASGTFEIYRGDSFQGMLNDPSQALLVAVLIRARLRAWDYANADDAKPLPMLPDARIGIGVGSVRYKAHKTIESDGEAFQNSGQVLDAMKNSGAELAVRTPWEEVNEELEVSCKLLDALINRWSSAMAEAVYMHLLEDITQQDLSLKLSISQPAVHKRLASANIDAVEACINRFQKLITNHV